MTDKKSFQRVLTIAGSDSSGGAGIQADLKTIHALGCFGLTAITAITAQNSLGIQKVYTLPPEIIISQINSVLSDIGANALKIGMLSNLSSVEAVASALEPYFELPLIIDPVIESKDGSKLLDEAGIRYLVDHLLPKAFLVTPNLLEAEILSNNKISTTSDMELAAREILKMGCQAVLVKGGHLDGLFCNDCLIESRNPEITWFRNERIESSNLHGTGCSLASAIASLIAKGESLKPAIQKAKQFLTKSIQMGKDYQFGSGWGPLNFQVSPNSLDN